MHAVNIPSYTIRDIITRRVPTLPALCILLQHAAYRRHSWTRTQYRQNYSEGAQRSWLIGETAVRNSQMTSLYDLSIDDMDSTQVVRRSNLLTTAPDVCLTYPSRDLDNSDGQRARHGQDVVSMKPGQVRAPRAKCRTFIVRVSRRLWNSPRPDAHGILLLVLRLKYCSIRNTGDVVSPTQTTGVPVIGSAKWASMQLRALDCAVRAPRCIARETGLTSSWACFLCRTLPAHVVT